MKQCLHCKKELTPHHDKGRYQKFHFNCYHDYRYDNPSEIGYEILDHLLNGIKEEQPSGMAYVLGRSKPGITKALKKLWLLDMVTKNKINKCKALYSITVKGKRALAKKRSEQ